MENSNELIVFFFPNNTVERPAWGRCYLGIPGILGLSPDSSPTGLFRFPIWRRENGGMAGRERKRKQVFHFRTEKYFYYNRASNDRSVLSRSLTILGSVAGISHSRGRYFLIRGRGDAPLDGVAFSRLD